MKVSELDDVLVTALTESGNREIAKIEKCATADRPDNHTRLVVTFADGATAVIMVKRIVKNGRRYPDYEIPREAL